MKEIKKAQAAVAGYTIMSEIIEHVSARHPKIIDAACIDVVGIKATPTNMSEFNKEFDRAMNKRVNDITTFAPIHTYVTELEHALRQVQKIASSKPPNNHRMAQIIALCDVVKR